MNGPGRFLERERSSRFLNEMRSFVSFEVDFLQFRSDKMKEVLVLSLILELGTQFISAHCLFEF